MLAEETYKRKLGLIHASTDYVFGGIDNGPYYYNSEKSPINYYGLSSKAKLRDVIIAVREDERGHAKVNHGMADILKRAKNVSNS